nr:hypothetical protein [uncultured Agathobacter sp.]
MKKNMCYRNIMKEIKKSYKNVLEDEPKEAKIISVLILGVAFFLVLFEVLALATKVNVIFLAVFLAVFLGVFIILMIIQNFLFKKYKSYYNRKKEDINLLLRMSIDDEAKKYNVSKDELVIYLICNHKMSGITKTIATMLSILGTSFSIYYLPGYEERYGLRFFIVLLICNYVISLATNKVIDDIFKLDYFNFYITDSYSGMFSKIENENKR